MMSMMSYVNDNEGLFAESFGNKSRQLVLTTTPIVALTSGKTSRGRFGNGKLAVLGEKSEKT